MSFGAPTIKTHSSVDARPVKPVKIVVTGPSSAGKTTLIGTISEVDVVRTDRTVSDTDLSVKASTTVAMDFGRVTVDDDCVLFLFGTPGQRRFQLMWEILSEGMVAFILLVNATDARYVDEAADVLTTFNDYADVPYVVGVTHLDEIDLPADDIVDYVRSRLAPSGDAKVVACDVRRKEDVKQLILEALYGVMNRLEEASARRP